MDLHAEGLLVIRVLAAALLGGLVGLDREITGRSAAGIRTYASVAVGACLFGLVSFLEADKVGSNVDSTRIAAQVVSGIGFIGAGLIFRSSKGTTGLTTAATLWATAAIGLACAFGLYFLAVASSVILLAILRASILKNKHQDGAWDED